MTTRTNWKKECERLQRELAARDVRDEQHAAHRADLSADVGEDAARIIAGLERRLADAETTIEETARERDEAQARAAEFEVDAEFTRSLAAALGGPIYVALFRAGVAGISAAGNVDALADAVAERILG